jgi:hypothetical protein
VVGLLLQAAFAENGRGLLAGNSKLSLLKVPTWELHLADDGRDLGPKDVGKYACVPPALLAAAAAVVAEAGRLVCAEFGRAAGLAWP